jgi:hypothetical protein
MQTMERTRSRIGPRQRGALNALDVLVIGVLLALLLVAAGQEFPAFRDRTIPVSAEDTGPADTGAPSGS